MAVSSAFFRRALTSLAVVGALATLPALAAFANDGTPRPPGQVLGPNATALGDATIALFFDPTYVDTSTSGSGEAYNLQQTLLSQGHVVNTFTGTSTAAWTAALAGAQAVAVPELDNDEELGADLEPGALAALQAFVNDGGKLLDFSGRNFAFMEVVLGLADGQLDGNFTCVCVRTPAAGATPWASGPGFLSGNDSTDTLDITTAPAGSTPVYVRPDAQHQVGLALIPFGSGSLVWFGWDWYFEDGQDEAWFTVLDLTFAGLGSTPPTPPDSPPVTPVTPITPVTPQPVAAAPRFTG